MEDDPMRTFDLAPLYRATVGFDQIADLMDRVLTADTGAQSYPPYNIEKTGEDAWRISVAVAGFAGDDLSVEQRENALVISARKAEARASAPGCTAASRPAPSSAGSIWPIMSASPAPSMKTACCIST
jgi:HSP20 family molecular chaperone IbpA